MTTKENGRHKSASHKAIIISSLFLLSAFFCLSLTACQASHRANTQGQYNSGIVNGTDADGQEAWYGSVIGIATKNATTQSYDIFCSGTLIDEKTIVTAAHCLDYNGVGSYVVFGKNQSGTDVQGRMIVQAAFHEKFISNFPEDARDIYDIGVAQFSGGLPSGFHPAPILPDDTLLTTGADILLAGYGITDGTTQMGAGILRYTTVKIQNAAYGKTEVQTDERNNGSCNGDSGGPGLINVNGQYYVWGTTSRGDDACKNNGIYTKVTDYRDWIQNKLNQWTAKPASLPLATAAL